MHAFAHLLPLIGAGVVGRAGACDLLLLWPAGPGTAAARQGGRRVHDGHCNLPARGAAVGGCRHVRARASAATHDMRMQCMHARTHAGWQLLHAKPSTQLVSCCLVVAHVPAGVDAIVLQGSEAGGHRGTFYSSPADWRDCMTGTLTLVATVAAHVKHTPLLAAGGIMTGQQIVAALAAGALRAPQKPAAQRRASRHTAGAVYHTS